MDVLYGALGVLLGLVVMYRALRDKMNWITWLVAGLGLFFLFLALTSGNW